MERSHAICNRSGSLFGTHASFYKKMMTLIMLFMFWGITVFAQDSMIITGRVLSENNEPISGASITEDGTNAYTISLQDGTFRIQVKSDNPKLMITNVGYEPLLLNVKKEEFSNLVVRLRINPQAMENVVVVGYGEQKKESVVGAITQTTGEVLQRAGGVTNVGMALTGNLPGVVTISSTGMPGAEDPQILIRAQTSWNNSSPLILVDGIERSISSVDISSVESISVLKDASATAVFGVKGANGVILITTKQGKKGKANIQIRSNITTKAASKLPEKYDSFDALLLKNET